MGNLQSSLSDSNLHIESISMALDNRTWSMCECMCVCTCECVQEEQRKTEN
jgi:hypothetical protein